MQSVSSPIKLLLGLLVSVALFACGKKEAQPFQGAIYPRTGPPAVVFQVNQIDDACRAYAHLLAEFPAGRSGGEIASALLAESSKRGASAVLIGPGRMSNKKLEPVFRYYGVEQGYVCAEKWCGWNFAFDRLHDTGDFINLGAPEWNNPQVIIDSPFILQVAFFRCF